MNAAWMAYSWFDAARSAARLARRGSLDGLVASTWLVRRLGQLADGSSDHLWTDQLARSASLVAVVDNHKPTYRCAEIYKLVIQY